MTRTFTRNRGVRFIKSIESKGIEKGMNGDVVTPGKRLEIYVYRLDKIVELNQKEQSCIEVYSAR